MDDQAVEELEQADEVEELVEAEILPEGPRERTLSAAGCSQEDIESSVHQLVQQVTIDKHLSSHDNHTDHEATDQ